MIISREEPVVYQACSAGKTFDLLQSEQLAKRIVQFVPDEVTVT